MELKEFFERFLPNFESKWNKDSSLTSILIYKIICIYFPESFANYEKQRKEELQGIIDRVCKKQRENCSKAWGEAKDNSEMRAILTAQQPKIEDL